MKSVRLCVILLVASLMLFLMTAYRQTRTVETGSPGRKPIIPDIQLEHTPDRVRRGEAIAQMLCVQCHADDRNRLTGKRMTDLPRIMGRIYSANITRDSAAGIGRWTDGELLYFLRTGVRRDGSMAPAMPRFPLMADEDLQSVVAWLRSDALPVQPDPNEAPRSRYSLPVKLLAKSVLGTIPYPEKPIDKPDSGQEVLTGRYMADAVAGCFNCHSADFKKLNARYPERSKGYYAGGTVLRDEEGRRIRASNLTPDPQTGIGRYTREEFVRAVRMGVRPDGSVLRWPMFPHVTLTDAEAGAIYAYLRTLPPVRHQVK